MNKANLIGQRFGRLIVLRESGRTTHGQVIWKCVCDCGGFAKATTGTLRYGHTRSCGCLVVETAIAHGHANRTHGHRRSLRISRTYSSWSAMKTRCTNPSERYFYRYGGAGVKVCRRWLTFTNFLTDMGPRPKGTTLGRFRDSGNYKPGNCAWMTPAQQGAERRKAKQHGRQRT